MIMLQRLEELKQTALRELGAVKDLSNLESWRVRYLGRKSELTGMLRGLAELPIEERKSAGALANRIKNELSEQLEQKEAGLKGESRNQALLGDEALAARGDITLPGRFFPAGRLHPITATLREISDIFISLGFQIAEGPDVELEYYNFTALNMPAEHPARDRMSTFWMDYENERGEHPMLLRTHTTSATARTLKNYKPPIRAIEFGKVYRYEATDATHLTMLHMIDGIAVDKGITMADLKGTLYEFARRFFGGNRGVRFRCDFFPFVEPGVELAIECAVCHGSGCRMCGNSGWIEVAGAGMTHPKVLEYAGIDTKEYTSFAFGFGVDRLPLLRYGIEDIRLFFGNDLRFLKQF
ncbi:MAG: phenylalanine--tRNA ligase subunit alpha [Dehalococcoidales bacterium]|nr:phenylalanine--tRNA ligase subunit alpha [Dehalococcoidales bacterium]